MIKRQLLKDLEVWKSKKKRKPLILRGARQVGKTTLVKMFGKKFDYSINLNLEKSEHRVFFEKTDDVQAIINEIFLVYGILEPKKKILLFIDEIQESPKAINLLRYFYEETPDIYVIAAGSLLENALTSSSKIPVGRVEYLKLNPINFREFLEATNPKAAQLITQVPSPDYTYGPLLNLFHEYALIGGLPEVVATFIEDKKLLVQILPIYESLLQTYEEDVEKYARTRNEAMIVKHVMRMAPFEADRRIKFQHFGKSEYRSREVGEAFSALQKAGLLRLIYPTSDLVLPGIPNYKRSPRLQFLDTGVINYRLNLHKDLISIKDLHQLHKGKLIQHLITQEYMSIHKYPSFDLSFWVREKKDAQAEVDLVVPSKNFLIPVEVKSGGSGKLRSLHQFIDRCNHHYAVRIHQNRFSIERTKTIKGKSFYLMNLPYYLGTMLPDYIEWFLNEY